MERNLFLLPGLFLLSDFTLLRTVVEYKHAYVLLASATATMARDLREQLERALQAIEAELRKRGINIDEPSLEMQ